MANSTSLGVTASLSLTNNIVITNGFNIYVGTNQLTLSGSISGGLLALQSGTLTLSGNNSFSILATVGGTVTLQNGSALADDCRVETSTNTHLILDASEKLGGLAGHGTVSLGANTLTLGDLSFGADFSGVIEGTGAVVKDGSGTPNALGQQQLYRRPHDQPWRLGAEWGQRAAL